MVVWAPRVSDSEVCCRPPTELTGPNNNQLKATREQTVNERKLINNGVSAGIEHQYVMQYLLTDHGCRNNNNDDDDNNNQTRKKQYPVLPNQAVLKIMHRFRLCNSADIKSNYIDYIAQLFHLMESLVSSFKISGQGCANQFARTHARTDGFHNICSGRT